MIYKMFWILRAIFYKLLLKDIGFPSYIGKPIFICNYKRISIGKKVRIFPGSRIEVVDNSSTIILENNISIGQNLHLISGGKQELKICEDTTISANVFITNIDHEYKEIDKHILNQPIMQNLTKIGKNCFLGYGAVIQAGTILGEQCIVGSNAVVRGIFPNYCVIVGTPAKIIKRYNTTLNVWQKTNEKGEFFNEI